MKRFEKTTSVLSNNNDEQNTCDHAINGHITQKIHFQHRFVFTSVSLLNRMNSVTHADNNQLNFKCVIKAAGYNWLEYSSIQSYSVFFLH